jgi:hypothetical protein
VCLVRTTPFICNRSSEGLLACASIDCSLLFAFSARGTNRAKTLFYKEPIRTSQAPLRLPRSIPHFQVTLQ